MRILDNTKQPGLYNEEETKTCFELLLRDTKREGVDKLLEFLANSDFYKAPASSRFHNNFEGGLVLHCLNVWHCLDKMNKDFNLEIPNESVIISALLHDVCKINLYSKDKKFFKVEGETQWTSYTTWKYEDALPLGHGEKSIMMISKFIELTDLEMMMIRWHMGAFKEGEARDYSNATNYHKGVSAMHIADMQASSFFERTIDLQRVK